MPIHQPQKRYTYQDYCTWPDEERWEIIEGIAFNMSPAPSTAHQRILLNLSGLLWTALQEKKCIPFIAPTDVVLAEDTVVQPDIFVVCDRDKITEKNIQGAPDLVMEILSPWTEKKDRREKKIAYERHGVREYVLVNVEGRFAERFFREKDQFFARQIVGVDDVLVLESLENLSISMNDIFQKQG